jgi:hypothetical protein
LATRRIEIEILGNSADLERAFARASKDAKGFDRNIRNAGRGALAASLSFKGLGRSIAFASGAFLGGAGAIAVLKQSSSAASNLNEQLSKSNVVFGQSSKEIEEWSKTATTSLGLASDQAIEAAAGFGALLRPLGFTQTAAETTSESLVQLASDLASFSNTPVPDALQAIKSGLLGEIEPLRRYGVVLSEAAVQQTALQQTGKDSISQLTAQEKVAARLALIFKQTTLAQGDFARTSGGLANQQRILLANLREVEITLGKALNPEIQRVVTNLNKWLGSSENQRQLQQQLSTAVRDGTQILEGFARGLAAVREITRPLISLVGGLTKAIELLIIAMAARRVALFAGSLKLLGPAAATAAAETTAASTAVGGFGVTAAGAGAKVGKMTTITRGLASGNVVALAAVLALTAGLEAQAEQADQAARNVDMLWDRWLRGQRLAPGIQQIEKARQARTAELGQRQFNLPLPSGSKFVPRGLTVDEQLRQAIAAATLTPGTEDDVRALQAQRGRFQRALDFALKQIRLQRGNVGAFAKQAESLSSDVASINSQLSSIAEENARKAQEARDKVKAARQKELAALKAMFDEPPTRLTPPSRTTIAAWVRAATREMDRRAAVVRRARQFRALGLTSTGDELAPSRRALRTEATKIGDALKGTFLDTGKTRNLMQGIRKVLSGQLGSLSRDVRLKVKQLLDDLSGQLGDRGPLTRASQASSRRIAQELTQNLTLSHRQRVQLRQNIAGAHLLTVVPQAVGERTQSRARQDLHVHVGIDGRQVAYTTIPHINKKKRQSATQTSGRFAGNPNRFG